MSEDEQSRLGRRVDNTDPRPYPPSTPMDGRFCRVVPLDVDAHAEALFIANQTDGGQTNWDYMPYGPFDELSSYTDFLKSTFGGRDPFAHTVLVGPDELPAGIATYLRISESEGSIEVGHINFAPLMQRKPAGTEAMYLMMRRIFDELGYRRYEWKCNDLNTRSMAAARRYGFRYEGTHRQAQIVKGRNRDTAWFSILDSEWPEIRAMFEAWLHPSNFDNDGSQKRPLNQFLKHD